MAGKVSVYKLVVLGDGGVGKTALTIQLCLNHFVETYDPTIEDSYRKQVLVDGQTCIVEALDTAGQEEYTALRDQWIRDAEAVALVYDITCRKSFEKVSRFHHQILKVKESIASSARATASPNEALPIHGPIPIMLVGNKADRIRDRKVSTAEGYAFARELGCTFIETSAKDCMNVERAFYDLVRQLRQHKQKANPPESRKVQVPVSQNEPRSTPASRGTSFSSVSRFFHGSRASSKTENPHDFEHQAALDRVLIEAVKLDDRRGVKKLLAKGANVNAQPGTDGGALHAASALGYVRILKILLENGAVVNARGKREVTALQLASVEGHSAAVNLLLDAGASVDAVSEMYGTALLAASSRAKVDVARILIKRGADPNARGGPYGCALLAASVVGKSEMVKILIDAGASVNSRGEGNNTPLQVASFAGHVDVARLLVSRGADVNATGGRYGPPLKAANDFSHFEVFKFLMASGASEEVLKVASPGSSVHSEATETLSATAGKIENATAQGSLDANGSLEDVAKTSLTKTVSQEYHNRVLPIHQRSKSSSQAAVTESKSVETAQKQAVSKPLPETPVRRPSKLTRSRSAISHKDGHPRTNGQAKTAKHSLVSGPKTTSPLDQSDIKTIDHFEYTTAEQIPFKALRVLGHGTFGLVEEVELSIKPGTSTPLFARKLVHIPTTSSKITLLDMLRSEVDIMKRLSHAHVVQVKSTYIHDRDFGIILSPVADINLEDYLARNPRPAEDSPMRHWFGCLAAGLEYMHAQNVRHKDIKPANILVKGSNVLFTDFGIARDFQGELTTAETGLVASKTTMYCAPEVAAEERRGHSSDTFSLGCVFLEMATVLMWESGVSLDQLHEYKVTDGRKEYYANLDKTLVWILGLFGRLKQDPPFGTPPEQSGLGANTRLSSLDRRLRVNDGSGFMLEWCFAMLQPDENDRIAADSLVSQICTAERAIATKFRIDHQSKPRETTSWVGDCCQTWNYKTPVSLSTVSLIEHWPNEGLWVMLGKCAGWTWKDVGRTLGYRFPAVSELTGLS